MQNFVIIPSSIGTLHGSLSIHERYIQTIIGIKSIKEKIPNVVVVLSDSSIINIDDYKNELGNFVDHYLDFSSNQDNIFYSQHCMKSHGELLLFKNALSFILDNYEFNSINRIFKIGGRVKLSEEFNFSQYDNTENKYVFKTPQQSWINPEIKLYETRIYSFHRNNITDYINKWSTIFNSCEGAFQVEHSYWKHLNQNDIIHFDDMQAECIVAATGQLAKD